MVQSGLATAPIYRFGSDEQKERFLLPAIRGEKIGAFGFTEPDVGSDAAAIKTKAVRDGSLFTVTEGTSEIQHLVIANELGL